VTNCAGAPVTISGGWTQINLPTSDVIVRCTLAQLAGSTGVKITAHSILVDGPGGGSIVSTGSNGIQLTAGSGSLCDAGATVDLESTTVTDGNINGGLKITACGDLVVNASSVSSAGNTVTVTSSKGKVCATGAGVSFSGRAVSVTASGNLTMHGSTVTLTAPSDAIKLVSNNGSVLAGGGVCPPNRFQGVSDSSLTVTAKQMVDLSNACVEIGENITLTASGTGFACATDTILNLNGSEVRNDFGNDGEITATACGGTGRINIGNAILVDSGKGTGAAAKVSKLNGSLATQPGSCPSMPNCANRALDSSHNPVKASPADRSSHNVVGVPRCDS
jgi:hypothetical protein